jgi:hypothetical protein
LRFRALPTSVGAGGNSTDFGFLHLYLKYIPVFSSCGYAPLLHGEKKFCDTSKSIVISPRGIR